MSPATGSARVAASSIAVVGAACRLPGAPDEAAFWRILLARQHAVTDVPAGRWHPERFLHPRRSEPGFSYSFAGGYIDAPLAFDPSVFGISPREAAEMDPQQRLLLEATWSALENAGVPPSALAGRNVGVFVGASSLDYGNLQVADLAAIDSHFMTGNTLSVLSNRISYVFDLRGPSFTVDTACSSSLVAFAQAQAAIASGCIDIAIVAGVNLLLSPFPFIGFSRAGMLSPTGLCRPFSAAADGYVRGEGVVAMVVARLETAVARGYPVRAVALASGVNSDGRTNGIALPATEGQRGLLEQIYGEAGLHPDRLAFVEAHGTGTRVGDPAEAAAIGQALGRRRGATLPVGSVKSNIGHLEPASGLAGLFKAILALEHRRLPASLHADALNPAIDFAELNLALAREPAALPATGTWLAGVSSFGFGGTNAHVVLRHAEPAEQPAPAAAACPPAELLLLSAYSRAALRDTALACAGVIDAGTDPACLAASLAWQRDAAPHRAAVPATVAAAAALRGFAETGSLSGGAEGTAPSQPPRTCFAYAGNGSQWVGMGRAAYARNAAFQARFRAVDASFARFATWSLTDALHDPDLATSLRQAELIQPLLFAVQAALTAGLASFGLRPDVVLGHSLGEIAAAEACGALTLDEAVRIVFHRSAQQEAAHGLGGMAVANISREGAEALFLQAGLSDLEVAAVNSPGSISLSGPMDAVHAFARLARKRRVAARVLDLPYPFHCSLLDPVRTPLLRAFGTIAAAPGHATFVSTVTGTVLPGEALDAGYWWRNVRQPVLFSAAIEAAGRGGATVFLEVGPRPILQASIAETLRAAGLDGQVLPSLLEKAADGDPVVAILARAAVLGCKVDAASLFGARPAAHMPLLSYAWQRKPFEPPHTSEALDLSSSAPRHKLIGARLRGGTPEWRNLIDATIVPYLADHRIDGEVVLPGSALAEMALAVARETYPAGPVGLEDFDLLAWLPLPEGQMRELSVRLLGEAVVEVWSRPRLAATEWTLHARGRITQLASPAPVVPPKAALPHRFTADQVYASAEASGVSYGPAFRRVLGGVRSDVLIEAELSPYDEAAGTSERLQVLHPIALDAAFHAMFDNIKRRLGERHAYLPVRFAALRVQRDHAVPARARVAIRRETEQSLTIDVMLIDRDGQFVAGLSGGLFRAVVLERRVPQSVFYQQHSVRLSRHDGWCGLRPALLAALAACGAPAPPDSWLYLGAFARALAFQTLHGLFGAAAINQQAGVAAGAEPLLFSLLASLQRAGLATQDAAGWHLAAESGLPAPADILQTFAAEHPAASAEIVLAARALAALPRALAAGQDVPLRPAMLEHFESSALLLAPVLEAARAVCAALHALVAPAPLRVLVAEPFCLGILRCLAPLLRDGSVTVTVIGTDARRLNLARARHAACGVSFLAADPDGAPDASPAYDLALALALAPLLAGEPGLGRAIASRLAPGGQLCLLQPPDSAVFDCLLGTDPDWFAHAADPLRPLGRIAAAQDGRRAAAAAGLGNLHAHALGEAGSILVAEPVAGATAQPEAARAVALLADWPELADALRETGHPVRAIAPQAAGQGWPAALAQAGGQAEYVFQARTAVPLGLDRALVDLAAILGALQAIPCRLWVVVCGLHGASAACIDPAAEALWSFVRVATNEYPAIDLRLVDVAPGLAAAEAAQRLAAIIARPGEETELLLDATGTAATRIAALPPPSVSVPAARLHLVAQGALASFDWVEATRRAPEAGEAEVAIAAAGLNFRDVMLASGLLDDDVLDDGMAGAAFGFECAGHVLRVGEGVTHLKPGDAVMGFGRDSFATHATADARVFARVPDGISAEAAATIPVAFLTAWYALVHLAQIQPGEWVLIHGAAGGVGLAALQVARLRGARVAATAGSPEKRALVTALGAEVVFNSRSTAFLDEIRAGIGGVDVVLNSLSGEAMQAGLKCLRPFGRFVELGKRDYVLNTALALRPFRRNLSYFGVDLDQLLAANLKLVERLLGDLAGHFATGALCPLPYRAFEWHETGAAFALMQSAGHVGKILVRPAANPVATSVLSAAFRPGAGAHLVVGGAGGFGFEAAAWLAGRGAATVVVASRRGAIEPQLQARADAIRAGGTTLLAAALDVTDAGAVAALVARLERKHGRLAGVIQAATVLDDGLITGMTPSRMRAALAPKVDGTDNLDRATRGLALDYFVAFSSAATLAGNPGQGAYVAANGYLQGVMARRRAAGLPGLAIGWGPIADAGILARDTEAAGRLARLSGIEAMASRAALDHLDTLLARPAGDPATTWCALLRAGGALQGAKLLHSPSFAGLSAAAEGSPAAELDLAGRIEGKSEGDARAIVAALVAAEVGRIFRLPPEEVELTRPLDEIGLDSMMSLDLRMSIEKRFAVELPMAAITTGISVHDLAGRLVGLLRSGAPPPDEEAAGLARRHGIDDATLAAGLAARDAASKAPEAVAAQ